MPFRWKKLFPDISYFRTKRSKKNVGTQSTLGESDIEGDTSARPADSNTSALRIASDVAQAVLPGVAAVAGVIPVAGAPLQAAISGLLFILQGIDGNLQNKQDIAGLKLLLEELRRCLDDAPIATDSREQYRRDFLTRALETTSSTLANINKCSTFTARATKVIAGCSSDINRYLLLYAAAAQMQVQGGVGAILSTLQSNQSPGTFTLRCVTLVDAAGDEHHMPMEFCHSFEQLSTILQGIFKVDSNRAQIQRRYLEAGQYNLSIDRNTEVTQLTSNYWPTIEAGTKIIMSIVVTRRQRQQITKAYQCYSCETWNTVSSINKSGISLIDCEGCGRRLQSSTDSEELKQPIKMTNRELSPVGATAADIQFIRNWHFKQKLIRDVWIRLPWEPPPPDSSEDLDVVLQSPSEWSEDEEDVLSSRHILDNSEIPEYQGSHISGYEDGDDEYEYEYEYEDEDNEEGEDEEEEDNEEDEDEEEEDKDKVWEHNDDDS